VKEGCLFSLPSRLIRIREHIFFALLKIIRSWGSGIFSHELGFDLTAVPGSTPTTLLLYCFLSWRYQTFCFAFIRIVFDFSDIAVGLPWSWVARRGHSHDLVSKLTE
jgi:hypothetical protein